MIKAVLNPQSRAPFLLAPLMASLLALLSGCSRDTSSTPPPPSSVPGTLHTEVFNNPGFETGAAGTPPPSWTITSNLNSAGVTGTDTNPPTSIAQLNLSPGGATETFIVQSTALGAPQSDPDVAAVHYPLFGKGAARLNFANESGGASTTAVGANHNVNTMSQQMTVGVNDVDPSDGQIHIRFAVAPVLENPAHTFNQQPYYFVVLTNDTKGTTLYADFNGSGQSGVPWQSIPVDLDGNQAQYLPWGLADIHPGTAALTFGDKVTLTVIASGCQLGGHWGRVYVDGVGPTVPGLFVEASGPASANAGSNITYNLTYENGGTTASAADTTFSLVIPTGTTFQSVSLPGCSTPAVGAAGTVTCPLGALAAGQSGTFTLVVQITAGTAAGTVITNGNYDIASASASYELLGPKVKTTVTTAVNYADLSVTKTDGVSAVTWGQTGLTYTIVASNAGPTAVIGATVTDTIPAQLTGATWTCATTSGGGTCTASGSGNINDSNVNLPSGASVTYTLKANVIAGSGTGSVSNVVSIATPASVTDPNTANNSAGDTDTIGVADSLTVTKNAAAGGTITSVPAAISCGTSCTTATSTFADGSAVILNVSAATGWTFTGWTGACASSGTSTSCHLTAAPNMSVGANFIGPPATITVNGGGTQSTNVSTAFGTPFSVLVSDVLGDPLPGVTVTFTPPGAGASVALSSTTAVTNASGIASVTGTANATPGAYSMTASAPGVATPATFSLTNLGPPASIAVVSGTPQSATVGTAFGAPLVVVVKDAAGDVLPNTTVTFTAPGTGASAQLSSGTATTNSSGQASITATANNTAGGPYNVTATVNGHSTTFALTNTSAAAAKIVVTGGTPQSTTVATAFGGALTARVEDSLGNPVAGVTVTFAGPGTGASAVLTTPTVVSDASGNVSTTATANTHSGAYSVTASSTGLTSGTFALTNLPGAPAAITATSGSGQSLTVGSTGAPLVVTVVDAFGNPVPGATVTYTDPSTGASAGLTAAPVTNAAGQTSVTPTANGTAGSYTVTATIGGLTATFSITNTAGAAASLTISSGNNQNTTVGTAFAAPIVALVKDSSGNPVSGVAVTFTPPGSGASAAITGSPATTNAQGLASVTATANTVAGSYGVVATAGALTATATLTNNPGPAASISVSSGNGQSTTVNTAFGSPLVVVVKDANGNVIPNAQVTFTAPGSGASAVLVGSPATTSSSGQASVTATANGTAGSYTVTATVNGISTTFSLTNTAGAAASLTVSSGNNQSTTVGTAFGAPLVALLKDAAGNPVAGTPITFTAPGSGASATITGLPATTDGSGLASVTATANTVAGSYSVTATAGALSATFTLTNTPGAPASITVSSGDNQSAAIGQPFGAPLVVVVKDASGNVIPNAQVAFTAPGSGASAVLAGSPATTNSSGQASVTATANNTAGSYSVTATVGGISATFTLTNTAGPAAIITVSGGNNQSTAVSTPFPQPLVALVTDAQGNPVSGATVTFAPPSSGASATLTGSPATTNSSGLASVNATANGTAGKYSVTASISGGAAPATFTLTNTAGAAAKITIVSGDAQTATVGTAYGAPLVAQVTDASGNPVPNALVSFSDPASGATAALSATVATSDSSGNVSVTAIASTVSGPFQVTAALQGATSPVHFNLKNLPGAAVSILIVPGGSPQSATEGSAFGAPLAVIVVDAFGNPVPGATVTYAAPGSGASAVLSSTTATTDANGQASITATAGATAGSYTVTATLSNGTEVNFNLTNLAGAAATITAVSGTPQSAAVATAFAAPLVAQVKDGSGNPIANALVVFTVPLTGATATLGSLTAVTDSTGTVKVQATAGTVAGSYDVSASATGVAAPALFHLTNNPGAPAFVVADPSSTPQTTQVNTAFPSPLVVTVTDSFGNPISGVAVTMTPPSSGASAVLSAPGGTTDASGRVSITATANGSAGSYAVTATVNGVATPATFQLTNTAGSIATIVVKSGSGQSATVNTAFASPLVALVRDGLGNPIAGATVTFTAPATAPTATLSANSATTDNNGLAQVNATAGQKSGNYDVVASVGAAAAPATFNLTNTAGPPVTITAAALSTPQSTAVSTQFAQPLTVSVQDSFGNGVPNVTVTYAAPASGATASLSANAPATQGDGTASVVATASATAGTYSVTATVSGVSTPATFALTNTSGAPATVSVASGGGQSTMVTTAFANPVVITVKDSAGNPVANTAVTVAVPTTGASATFAPTSPTTDANGSVSITFTANATPGTYSVSFSIAGGQAPATTSLTNTPIPTTTTLAASDTSPVEGSNITLTAAVAGTPGTPTGTVQFFAGTTSLGTATLSNGVATLTIVAPAAGTYSVTATYAAQGSYGASTSNVVTLNVQSAAGDGGTDGGDAGDGGVSEAGDGGSDGAVMPDAGEDGGPMVDSGEDATTPPADAGDGSTGPTADGSSPPADATTDGSTSSGIASIQGGGCTCSVGAGSANGEAAIAPLGFAFAVFFAQVRRRTKKGTKEPLSGRA